MPRPPIASARVLLEACPPAVKDRERAYAVLRQSFACYSSFHAVSVPDIQDNGEFRRARERVPNDEFATWLREEVTEKALGLYKVCTTCTPDQFSTWLERASRLSCQDVFLVGGDSSETAGEHKMDLATAASLTLASGMRPGGIIIPTRRRQFAPRPASTDESERVVQKVRELGLGFFSTQILYEGEWTSCLLLDLVRAMQPEELPKIFLTFSPFVCEEDLLFARRILGVYIPADVDRMLRGARSMREASISTQLLVWERISTFAGEIGYPAERLGVNVEYLDSRNPRNVDAAFELAEEFGRLFKR